MGPSGRRPPSTVALALVVAIVCLTAYLLTAADQGGYEPESAAVAEGLARTGHFVMVEGSPLVNQGRLRPDGQLTGRVGLPQPLLEAPFYLVGQALDELRSGGEGYSSRVWALRMFNPAMVALTAVAIFLMVLALPGLSAARRPSVAVATALLFGLASIALVYAQVGMEPTLMAGWACTVLAVLWARRPGARWPWLGLGVAAGWAIAAKPYALFTLLPLLVLLWAPLRALPWRGRLERAALALVPAVGWGVAFLLYNEARTGSIWDVGNAPYDPTAAFPLNALGVLVAPGKGLALYSPLVVLGAIGWWRTRALDPLLSWCLAASFLVGVLAVGVSAHWSDETWGPRYAVFLAWMPLLGLPWWMGRVRRRAVLAAVAAVAVAVQVVGSAVSYQVYFYKAPSLIGSGLFAPRLLGAPSQRHALAPVGRDALRWVPQVSPLLVQSAALVSRVGEALGAGAITYDYAPYDGLQTRTSLSKASVHQPVPYYWWAKPQTSSAQRLLAVVLLAVLAAQLLLVRRLVAPAVTHPQRSGPLA